MGYIIELNSNSSTVTPNTNMGKRKTKVLQYSVTHNSLVWHHDTPLFYFLTSHDSLGLPDTRSAVIDPDLHNCEMEPLLLSE